MFGIFGIILDAIVILFGLWLILTALFCGIFKVFPKMLEWIGKLLINPAFWLLVLFLTVVL